METEQTPEQKPEVQTTTESWLDKEMEQLDSQTEFDGVKLPALQLEENKITEFTIDFSKPFDKWLDEANKTNKAIIPVTHDKQQKVWWLNTKNPIYKEIVRKGREGITDFKVMQTGNKATTKYNLVVD